MGDSSGKPERKAPRAPPVRTPQRKPDTLLVRWPKELKRGSLDRALLSHDTTWDGRRILDSLDASGSAESQEPWPVAAAKPTGPKSIEQRLEAARARHFALVDLRETTQAAKQAVALAHAEVWRLEATRLHGLDEPAYDAAAKANAAALGLEQLAAKLERDSLADRVAELERRLSSTRSAAAGLADLDE